MKRGDIRKGTLYIMGVIIVAFIFICIFAKSPSVENDKTTASGNNEILWSDTLANSDVAELKGMDSKIESFMRKWDIRGISFAIMRNDSLVYARGFGWANEEENEEMTPRTVMRIASASKLITAAAIMKLIEEGKLSLSSKVFGSDGILNDTLYTNNITDERLLNLTVDHLLLHQGGFTGRFGDPMFNTKDIATSRGLVHAPTSKDIISTVVSRRLNFSPGEGRRYSNFGYMLLSEIVEKVSGKSYWEYVEEEFMLPGKIDDMLPATNYYKERHPGEARYYGPDNELVEEFDGSGNLVERVYGGHNINGLRGAGGWLASAPALARFVALIDGDTVVPDLLNTKSISLMTQFDEEEKLYRGWSEIDEKGKWSRTGTLSSSHALIERFPDGECWVMLTNTGVWTGHHFSRQMENLINTLKAEYGSKLPKIDLW